MTFTVEDIFQIALFVAALAALTPIIGKFMKNVFTGKRHILSPVFGGLERSLYKMCGVDPELDMDWKRYAWAMLLFNFFGFAFLFVLQRTQQYLPLNPQHVPGTSWDLAFNTAMSFMTNTNWQSYAGETTLSYMVQMAGLTVQNFVSAATGIAIFLALTRGFTKKESSGIGNFWVDLIRSTVHILLPFAIVWTVLLFSQGVIQNFTPYQTATTLEGTQQTIPMGPAASQIAIKQLGTNGGGFFNMNSAHPFENPTPFSNFLEMLAILLLSSSLVYTFGSMVGSLRQGRVLWGVMIFLLLAGLTVSLVSEYHGNPVTHIAGSMEGKETRFGVTNSVLWSVVTTDASNGSVNAMHDSLTPLSGLVCLVNMMIGEVIFGGVGAGMYGMLIFVILTVFIAGLMVGRTPEYLGKKIEAFEVKMAMLGVIAPSASILIFTALALSLPAGLAGMSNNGPHGFSQVLYAFTSGAANNGSAFAGVNANTPFYNVTIGIDIFIGRFGIILPVLAIAGGLAKKKIVPASSGTFRTDTMLFAVLLIGVILIVGGLTFFPALTLGPVVEHLLMHLGHGF